MRISFYCWSTRRSLTKRLQHKTTPPSPSFKHTRIPFHPPPEVACVHSPVLLPILYKLIHGVLGRKNLFKRTQISKGTIHISGRYGVPILHTRTCSRIHTYVYNTYGVDGVVDGSWKRDEVWLLAPMPGPKRKPIKFRIFRLILRAFWVMARDIYFRAAGVQFALFSIIFFSECPLNIYFFELHNFTTAGVKPSLLKWPEFMRRKSFAAVSSNGVNASSY